MKIGFLFFTILFSASINAVQISPEAEVERYLLEAEHYLGKNRLKSQQTGIKSRITTHKETR